MERLSPDVIRCDGGTQSREFNNETVIAKYKEAMLRGDEFTPVVVFKDADGVLWLADGFHRIRAAKDAELSEINADVREGSLRDAVLYSVGANEAHGFHRNLADRRRAINLLLDDDEWRQRTDNWIAETCRVDHKTVEHERSKHPKTPKRSVREIPNSKREGKDGKMYPAKKAPREQKAPLSPLSHTGATSTSHQNRSNLERTTPAPPANDERELFKKQGHLTQEPPSPESEKQEMSIPNSEESSTDRNDSPNLPDSFKSPIELCQFVATYGSILAEDGTLFGWLVGEAQRLSVC